MTNADIRAAVYRRWCERRRALQDYPTGCHNLDIEAPMPAVTALHGQFQTLWRLRRTSQRAARRWAELGHIHAAENNHMDARNAGKTIRTIILPRLRAAYTAERAAMQPSLRSAAE